MSVPAAPINVRAIAAPERATVTFSEPATISPISVYSNGVFSWAGDWSGIAGINYTCRSPMGVTGKSACIYIPKAGQWAFWLAYPHIAAGAPAPNKIGCNLAGMRNFTIAVRPAVAGLTPTVSFTNGTGHAFGVGVTLPASPANQWVSHTVALADFKIGTPGWIYTLQVQQHGTTPQAWCLDNVGFY